MSSSEHPLDSDTEPFPPVNIARLHPNASTDAIHDHSSSSSSSFYFHAWSNIGVQELLQEHHVAFFDWSSSSGASQSIAGAEAPRSVANGETQTPLSIDQSNNVRIVSPPPAYSPYRSRLGSIASFFKSRPNREAIELGQIPAQREDRPRRSLRRTCHFIWTHPSMRNTRAFYILLMLFICIAVCFITAIVAHVVWSKQAAAAAATRQPKAAVTYIDGMSHHSAHISKRMVYPYGFMCGDDARAPSCTIYITKDATIDPKDAMWWVKKHCQWQWELNWDCGTLCNGPKGWRCKSTRTDGIENKFRDGKSLDGRLLTDKLVIHATGYHHESLISSASSDNGLW